MSWDLAPLRSQLSGAKGLEPKYGWTWHADFGSPAWLVSIQRTAIGALCMCRWCHKSWGSCHISEPEFVETLLLLREGWQGGEGKQKEAWSDWKDLLEKHSVQTFHRQTLACCHVAVLEFLFYTVFFYLMYQPHFWDSENPDQVGQRYFIIHYSIICLEHWWNRYCQNPDIPILSPVTKLLWKFQHVWWSLKECTVSTSPLHQHALRKDKKKDKKANPC